ncbi:hypothetical protein ACH4TQ_49695 [Streptomyces sp. NPDC021218]|uniref:hypothetical protein n=1 Tax=Streptomyces sp. NPDC021218 TaxID=3365119 RepID=UPI003790E731
MSRPVTSSRSSLTESAEDAPAVALVFWEEFAGLRRLRDQADITEADHRKATDGAVVTHEAFMAELEA